MIPWPIAGFVVIFAFFVGVFVGSCEQQSVERKSACVSACHKANLPGMHDADGRFCVCSDGTSLVYDRSGMYQRVVSDGGLEISK